MTGKTIHEIITKAAGDATVPELMKELDRRQNVINELTRVLKMSRLQHAVDVGLPLEQCVGGYFRAINHAIEMGQEKGPLL